MYEVIVIIVVPPEEPDPNVEAAARMREPEPAHTEVFRYELEAGTSSVVREALDMISDHCVDGGRMRNRTRFQS